MVEEFRALVVDTVVWKLALNQQVTHDDFDYPKTAGEGCFLKPHARQTFIKALEEKLNSAIAHPGTGIALDYRRCNGISCAAFIPGDTRHGNRLSGHGAAMTRFWLITYDICDDDSRQKEHNILKD